MSDENTNPAPEPSQPPETPPPSSDVRPEPIVHPDIIGKSQNPDRYTNLEKGDSKKE